MNNPLFHDNDAIYFSKWDPIQHPPQLKSSKGHQSLVVHILIRNCQYAKNKQTNKHCPSMQLLHWITVAKAEMGLKATLTITIYGKKCHIFKWESRNLSTVAPQLSWPTATQLFPQIPQTIKSGRPPSLAVCNLFYLWCPPVNTLEVNFLLLLLLT